MDRLDVDPEDRERLVDSLEAAIKKGEGKVTVRTGGGGRGLVFSERLECKACGIPFEESFPNLFSFNSPQGACTVCHGFGDLAVIDEEKIVPDKGLSLEAGAVEPWTKPVSRGMMKELLREARKRRIPTGVPFRDLKREHQRFVLEGGDGYPGVQGFFDWLQTKKYKVQVRVFLSRYRKYTPCPACKGLRLNPRALSVRIGGFSIGQVCRMTVRKPGLIFAGLGLAHFEKRVADKLLAEIRNRLKFLLEVGLDYITLDRMTCTLSGGEAQRINLASARSR